MAVSDYSRATFEGLIIYVAPNQERCAMVRDDGWIEEHSLLLAFVAAAIAGVAAAFLLPG